MHAFVSFPVHKYLHLRQERKTGGSTWGAFLQYLLNSCLVFPGSHWRQPVRNVPATRKLMMTWSMKMSIFRHFSSQAKNKQPILNKVHFSYAKILTAAGKCFFLYPTLSWMLHIDKAWAFCIHFSNWILEFLIKSFTFLVKCCPTKHLLEVEWREGETDRGKEGEKQIEKE